MSEELRVSPIETRGLAGKRRFAMVVDTRRCIGCLSEIAGRHRGEEVVVVTHGLVLDALYRAAHRLEHGAPRPVPLINASVNLFGYEGGAWSMEVWGDVSHLAPEQVTVYRGAATT